MKEVAPTTDELSRLHEALCAISPLSQDDLCELSQHSHRLHLPKGASLLKAGEQAHMTAFVLGGGLREYYVLEDGSERTKGFNMAGEFAGSLSDLLSGQPSQIWITAAASTDLICTPWTIYHQLSWRSPAWRDFARRFSEALYMLKVEREFELLALDAAQRLARVQQRWPDLARVFSQKDIASYVGVTPVHLSRLRSSSAGSHSALPEAKKG